MRVRIETHWPSDAVRVWFYRRRGDDTTDLFRPGDETSLGEWEHVPFGAEPEPSLVLPSEALEALVAAGADHLPPSSAQAEHLADTRAVRDRLLTLVERQVSD